MQKEIAALEQKSQEENFWNDQKEAKQLFAKLKGLRSVWEPVRDLAGDVAAFMELMDATSDSYQRSISADALSLIER